MSFRKGFQAGLRLLGIVSKLLSAVVTKTLTLKLSIFVNQKKLQKLFEQNKRENQNSDIYKIDPHQFDFDLILNVCSEDVKNLLIICYALFMTRQYSCSEKTVYQDSGISILISSVPFLNTQRPGKCCFVLNEFIRLAVNALKSGQKLLKTAFSGFFCSLPKYLNFDQKRVDLPTKEKKVRGFNVIFDFPTVSALVEELKKEVILKVILLSMKKFQMIHKKILLSLRNIRQQPNDFPHKTSPDTMIVLET